MKNKEKNQIIITAILGIVLIALVIRNLGHKSLPAPVLSVPLPAGPIASGPTADDIFFRLEAEAAKLPLKRDPFNKMIPVTVAGQQAILLKGIFWDDQKPTALINDQIVQEGDTILETDKKVAAILNDHVVVADGAQTIDLKLAE